MTKCRLGFVLAALLIGIGILLYVFAHPIDAWLPLNFPSIGDPVAHVGVGTTIVGSLLFLITFVRWLNDVGPSAAE